MNNLIIFCAKYLVIVPVLVVVYLEARALLRRQYEVVLFGLVAALFAVVLAKLGAHIVNDPRPFMHDGSTALVSSATDNGFPSDHTLLASIAACIGWHFNKKIGIALAVIAIAVAWGRVAAHVHHLDDVIAAMVMAVVGYLLAIVVFRIYHARRQPQAVSN